MPVKRLIATDRFNHLNQCYANDFFEHGHRPVRLVAKYDKVVESDKERIETKIPESVRHVLSCYGSYKTTRITTYREISPKLTIIFKDENSWDKAIDTICAKWGKEAMVVEVVTQNRDNDLLALWKRNGLENGSRAKKLILHSVDDVEYDKCHYKTQQSAAGDMWGDICEYKEHQIVTFRPICKVGSH